MSNYCPSCGSQNLDEKGNFCTSCGKYFPSNSTSDKITVNSEYINSQQQLYSSSLISNKQKNSSFWNALIVIGSLFITILGLVVLFLTT